MRVIYNVIGFLLIMLTMVSIILIVNHNLDDYHAILDHNRELLSQQSAKDARTADQKRLLLWKLHTPLLSLTQRYSDH